VTKRDQPPKDVQAAQSLKRLMFTHRLIPGQKLIYRDLEETLGMSKTPITNALARLEQEGLVVSKPNRGYFVKTLNEDEIHQMYQMRVKLEEISIDLAIDNYQKKDLTEWKKLIKEYRACQVGTYDYIRYQRDLDLHSHLARMGRNIFLIDIVSQFFLSTWALLQTVYLTKMINQFAKDHDDLFEAVKARNREEAKRIIRQHHQVAMEMALQGALD
jgi:DNA-binding GntR family transcriptional regulator